MFLYYIYIFYNKIIEKKIKNIYNQKCKKSKFIGRIYKINRK